MKTMNTRKDQASLSQAEKEVLVKALLTLKNETPSQLHPNDQNMHRYDDYVQVHMNAMMDMQGNQRNPGWAHQGPAFFPWHRLLLRKLELDLQQVANDPNLAIPYWNWTVDRTPESSIWKPDFMGGNGRAEDGRVMDGQFAFDKGKWTLRVSEDNKQDLQRSFGTNVAELPTAANVADALTVIPYDIPNWDLSIASVGNSLLVLPIALQNGLKWDAASMPSFRNRLEGWYGAGSIHNRVHVWVGGSMLLSTSPNDPVFWLHHCNVDRLWAVWQQRHPGLGYHPTGEGPERGPQGHNLRDAKIFADEGQPVPWQGENTVESVLDHHAMGYRYDTDPAEEEAEMLRAAVGKRVWFSVTE